MKRSARRALADMLDAGNITGLRFERQADNKWDANAIKVLLPKRLLGGIHIGYVRAGSAELLAPKMDAGTLELVNAELQDLDAEGDWHDGTMLVKLRDKKAPRTK